MGKKKRKQKKEAPRTTVTYTVSNPQAWIVEPDPWTFKVIGVRTGKDGETFVRFRSVVDPPNDPGDWTEWAGAYEIEVPLGGHATPKLGERFQLKPGSLFGGGGGGGVSWTTRAF